MVHTRSVFRETSVTSTMKTFLMLVFSYEFHETLEKPFLQNTLQITFNFCSTEKYFTNKIVNRTVAGIYQTKLTLSQQFLFEKPLFRHF